MEAAIWGVIGLLGGSIVTWLVSRHFYRKAAREKPEWADDLIREVVAKYEATHPDADPGDLVALFEEGLQSRGVVLDGGTF